MFQGYIKILNEISFLEKAKTKKVISPLWYTAMFIEEGWVKLETEGVIELYDKNTIMLASPYKNYRLQDHSKVLKLHTLSHVNKPILDNIDYDLRKFDVYQITQLWAGKVSFKIEEEDFIELLKLVAFLENQLKKETDNSIFFSYFIKSLFTSIVYFLNDCFDKSIAIDKDNSLRKKEITLSFFELVLEHYKQHKNLSFYADKLNISIKYLSISVKEITYKPASSFIALTVTNEAKRLLLETNYSISYIAEELNFSDQYSFGKFFKKHTNFSPLTYRKKSLSINFF
ncbi:AraC family transcriptional regulator [Chishuiella sp.]|uniref:helix-turn-helix domain-containing protein n=1 Tax=Chishuiella sp. TaxID=1969467 RepID=UPI0028AF30F9|nr:AraC family transcriptional regulator [Chishuiella sp.]